MPRLTTVARTPAATTTTDPTSRSMDRIQELLAEIQSGRSVFRPETSDEAGMVAFQAVAQALLSAERKGLLESCKPHQERTTRNRWTDCIVVGRLTCEGEQLLRGIAPDALVQNASTEDILQIRPTFCGVTLDVNALWRWIRRKLSN
jgi:hypothetical protein